MFKAKVKLKCTHCGKEIQSEWSGHFASHTCSIVSDHDVYIAIDETEHYCRYIGDPRDYKVIELS